MLGEDREQREDAIWKNTSSLVRPSSRPCSSMYSEPLNQANQIIVKMTANSANASSETPMARWRDAWPITAT